jgi:hypothetical protein
VVARVGDARRAGVRDESDPRAGDQTLDEPRRPLALDRVVVARERPADAVVLEQRPRPPRVLGRDEVRSTRRARSVTSSRLPIGVATT